MSPRNAIVVCGHAVYTALDFARPLADESWCHLSYQKGEAPSHVEHLRTGVRLAAEDDAALLVLAGGQTREQAGPRSEGFSYWMLAEHFGWWGHPEVRSRTILEEHSRDSIENMLFGICRFREYCGVLPHEVTVVSWEFKRARFGSHCNAIGWPESRFRFVGPNNPVDLGDAKEGEALVVREFEQNPFGTADMKQRRKGRNPFRRTHAYAVSCPELAPILLQLE